MKCLLVCIKLEPPSPQKNKNNLKTTPVASLMPPPDEIHQGVEIVVNTDINGQVLKKAVTSTLKYSLMLVK